MKNIQKFIEKVLPLLFLIGITSTGIKAQKTSPSALSIRDGTDGSEYSMEDWVDIYSSDDVIGGKNYDGYEYYVTTGGIKLWEPPSSFRSHFWKTLNSVAKCQNWTLDGRNFVPENEMDNLSWREIITDYCEIDHDPWKKDEIKVFGWSHDKSQKNSKIVPSPRASHPKEGKLCFNTANFQKVKAPSELIPLRSDRCTNPLEKKFECQKKQKVSFIQHSTPMVVYTPTNCSCPQQQTQFVYERPREQPQMQYYQPPQQHGQVSNTSTYLNFGLNLAYTAAGVLAQTQPQYYPQQIYYPQPQYYPKQVPQPVWNNPNPTLGNGYVDNGGPTQGNGTQPVSGGPTQGSGTFPVQGGPTQGGSTSNNGFPNQGNGTFNNGVSTQGNGTFNSGVSTQGNSGVSYGGPVQGGGGNPTLGNGPR